MEREGESFGIRASHFNALTRDLSLFRVPHRHYEERSRQPVWISERRGVIPSAGCSNWPLITDARLVSGRGEGPNSVETNRWLWPIITSYYLPRDRSI